MTKLNTLPSAVMRTNQEQRRFIQRELDRLNQGLRWSYRKQPLPPRLKALEREVKRKSKALTDFQRQQERAESKFRRDLKDDIAHVQHVSHFGTAKEAGDALEAFKAKYKKDSRSYFGKR